MSDPYANIDLRPIPIPEDGWRVGTKVIEYYHNNRLIAYCNEPIYCYGPEDPILNRIQDGDQIRIYHREDTYDDIPDPTPEDLEAAIQIMDRYKLPDPEVPRPQKTAERSWDSD